MSKKPHVKQENRQARRRRRAEERAAEMSKLTTSELLAISQENRRAYRTDKGLS
jgi:hypothetical protein